MYNPSSSPYHVEPSSDITQTSAHVSFLLTTPSWPTETIFNIFLYYTLTGLIGGIWRRLVCFNDHKAYMQKKIDFHCHWLSTVIYGYQFNPKAHLNLIISILKSKHWLYQWRLHAKCTESYENYSIYFFNDFNKTIIANDEQLVSNFCCK